MPIRKAYSFTKAHPHGSSIGAKFPGLGERGFHLLGETINVNQICGNSVRHIRRSGIHSHDPVE
jgi:hypothetical protein